MSETVVFFGINVSLLNISELTKKIQLSIELKKQLTISYINFHTTTLLKHGNVDSALLNAFVLIFPDGIALSWALRILGKLNVMNNKRIYVEVEPCLPSLYSVVGKHGWGIFFLGGKESAGAVQSVEKISQGFSDLLIVGAHHGFISTFEELKCVIDEINQSGAEILLVGMGQPKQEEWIIENKHKLNVSIIIAVGGYFDKISLDAKAYPVWVYRNRLFWLYRLIKEPRRLWKRYSIGIVIFGWRVLWEKIENNHLKKTKIK